MQAVREEESGPVNNIEAAVTFGYLIGIVVVYLGLLVATGEDDSVLAVAALIWPISIAFFALAALGTVAKFTGSVVTGMRDGDGATNRARIRRLFWKYDNEIEDRQ